MNKKDLLSQVLANYGPWTISGPWPVFVNKVLLKPSCTHLYAFGLCVPHKAELLQLLGLSNCYFITNDAKNIYSLALFAK